MKLQLIMSVFIADLCTKDVMCKDIEGTTVVVTGGAGGIGLAIADAFLRRGARRALLLDRDRRRGADAATNLNGAHGHDRAAFIACDVTKDLENVTKTILDTYKTVDVLVNNAGILNEREPRTMIEINLTAVIEWSLRFSEIMRSDRGGKGGTIINIASSVVVWVNPFVCTYKATKFGVLGFTKSKGYEYNFKKTGVRMFAICPGLTRTDLIKDYENIELEENREAFVKLLGEISPQAAEKVGEGTVEVFRKAASGTAWLIQEGNPIAEI